MRTQFDNYRELIIEANRDQVVDTLTNLITDKTLNEAIDKLKTDMAQAKEVLNKAIRRNVIAFWGYGLSSVRIEAYKNCEKKVMALIKAQKDAIKKLEDKPTRVTLAKYWHVIHLHDALIKKARLRLERKGKPVAFVDKKEGFKITLASKTVIVEDTITGIYIYYSAEGMTVNVPAHFIPGTSAKKIAEFKKILWPSSPYQHPTRYDHIMEALFGKVDTVVRRNEKPAGEGGPEAWNLLQPAAEEKVGTRTIVKDGD